MNEISLFYKEYELGKLLYEKKQYLWKPNQINIANAQAKYELGMTKFLLPHTNTNYSTIPEHFSDFSSGANRSDLVEKANIKTTDNEWNKLVKLSKLKFYNDEFVIKS